LSNKFFYLHLRESECKFNNGHNKTYDLMLKYFMGILYGKLFEYTKFTNRIFMGNYLQNMLK